MLIPGVHEYRRTYNLNRMSKKLHLVHYRDSETWLLPEGFAGNWSYQPPALRQGCDRSRGVIPNEGLIPGG